MSESRVTVAFCRTSSGDLTGTPKMILRLIEGLDTDRFRPRIVTQADTEFTQQARNRGIPVEIVPYRGGLDTYEKGLVTASPAQNFKTGLRILQYNYEVREALKDVDVIWCDDVRMALTLAPTIVAADASVILNVGLGLESNGPYKWLNELGFRLADHVFIESETQARRLYGEQYVRHQEKFTIFHKGLDTQKYSPEAVEDVESHDEGTIRIGTAATLTERKGHLEAVEAITDVVHQFPEKSIQYTIAGGLSREGHQEYKQRLDEKIADLGLEDVVEYVGWVDTDEMPAYYNSLDIFLLASEEEGIPGVVREALAMECAVVATDVGGTAEAVIDGETGYLVPPKDSKAISEAIASLIRSPDDRREMGAKGREHIVSEFSVDAYIDNYRTFLERIVD